MGEGERCVYEGREIGVKKVKRRQIIVQYVRENGGAEGKKGSVKKERENSGGLLILSKT